MNGIDFECDINVDRPGSDYYGTVTLSPIGYYPHIFHFQCICLKEPRAAYAVARDPEFMWVYGCAFADPTHKRPTWRHTPLCVDWANCGKENGHVVLLSSLLVLDVLRGFEARRNKGRMSFRATGRWLYNQEFNEVVESCLYEHFSIRMC